MPTRLGTKRTWRNDSPDIPYAATSTAAAARGLQPNYP